jgi:hypothetical protein
VTAVAFLLEASVLKGPSDLLGGPLGYVPILLTIVLLASREVARERRPAGRGLDPEPASLRLATVLLVATSFAIILIRLLGLT